MLVSAEEQAYLHIQRYHLNEDGRYVPLLEWSSPVEEVAILHRLGFCDHPFTDIYSIEEQRPMEYIVSEFKVFLARWRQASDEHDHPIQSMAFAAMINHARSILSVTDSQWSHHSTLGQDTLALDYVLEAIQKEFP